MQSYLEDVIPQIEMLEEYSLMSDEILGMVNEIEREVGNLDSVTFNNEKRLLALLEHFKIEDPYVKDIKENIKMIIIWDLRNKKKYNKKEYLKELKEYFPRYREDFLESCFEEAIKELKK